MGSEDDLDLYAYTGDDPVNETDPTGNEAYSCAVTVDRTDGKITGASQDCTQTDSSDPTKVDVTVSLTINDSYTDGRASTSISGNLGTVNETAIGQSYGQALSRGIALKTGVRFAPGSFGNFPHRSGANTFGLPALGPSNQLRYDDRVYQRSMEDPRSHNFPYSYDDEILQEKPILKPNGYKIYQKQGEMNGKQGVFEIGVRSDGVIDHRFFRPY